MTSSAPTIRPGDVLEMERRFTQADFDLFARISGDDNPIHVDPDFSARTHFGRTVSHGMLLYTVMSGLLARAGVTGRQEMQSLMFPNPTFTEDPIRLVATCTERTNGHVTFRHVLTRIRDGAVVCEGASRHRLSTDAGASA